MKTKICTKCAEEKPQTTEFYNLLSSGSWRGSCKKCQALNTKKHYDKDPQKVIARADKYKQQAKEADGFFTEQEKTQIKINQSNQCYYCGVETLQKGEFDHKTPVSQGGDSWPANMVWACLQCNRDKHGKSAKEFFVWRRKLGLKISLNGVNVF